MDNVPTREVNEVRNRTVIPPPASERPTEPASGHSESSTEIAGGGSWTEAVGGIAVVVLAIISLAGGLPMVLAPIAVIVLGVAFWFESATTTARFGRLLASVSPTHMEAPEFGGGASAEFLGGSAGVVLGILALVGVYPLVLISVAVLVFGVAELLSTGTTWRLNRLAAIRWAGGHETAQLITGSMVSSSCGMQAAVGIGAIVLGILALVGLNPLVLCLVALLCLGAAVTDIGASVGSRMVAMLRH